MKIQKKQTFSRIALAAAVVIWGAGFVFSQILLNSGLSASFVNMVRFSVATVIVGIVFFKRIKLSKNVAVFGLAGGAMMFAAFMFQLEALHYTTPAYNGFFTVGYILIVPIVIWIIFKRKPSIFVTVGMLVAIVGFFILNFGDTLGEDITSAEKQIMKGNLLTLGSALFFALQIVMCDYALNRKKVDAMSLTFSQLAVGTVLFAVWFLAFDLKVGFGHVDWNMAILPLCFVAFLGTAFAYPAQTNAQLYVAPAETSLILSAEALIGTVLSVLVGFDRFSWHIAVGGFFVIVAVLTVEVLPEYLARRTLKKLGISVNTDSQKNDADQLKN